MLSFPLNLVNNDMVRVSSGTLELTGSGSGSGGYDLASGTRLDLTAGSYTWGQGAEVTGNGWLRLNSATLLAAGSVSVDRLEQVGGAIAGSGTLRINRAFVWSGGLQGGNGRTQIAGNAVLQLVGSGEKAFPEGRALEILGEVEFLGDGILAGGPDTVIDNFGSMRADAELSIDGDAFGEAVGLLQFNNFGSVSIAGSGGTVQLEVDFQNQGDLTITGRTVQWGGVFESDGEIILDGAVMRSSNDLILNSGGSLRGTGMLHADLLNAGVSDILNGAF